MKISAEELKELKDNELLDVYKYLIEYGAFLSGEHDKLVEEVKDEKQVGRTL